MITLQSPLDLYYQCAPQTHRHCQLKHASPPRFCLPACKPNCFGLVSISFNQASSMHCTFLTAAIIPQAPTQPTSSMQFAESLMTAGHQKLIVCLAPWRSSHLRPHVVKTDDESMQWMSTRFCTVHTLIYCNQAGNVPVQFFSVDRLVG